MRKIIHSKFELDLSGFVISDTEINNQFSDAFFTNVTFPFEIDLIKDLDVAFGFISLINASEPVTYFEVKYVHDDTIEDAVFEIEQYQQRLSCTLSYGFDQLPSWEKKLSELSLEKFDLPVGTTIYAFANTIVSQTWPAVNYNFPQVHTDKYDGASDEWFWFKNIINNREAGIFTSNYFDSVDEESRNYNIIQPLPYWIYILQRGMIDAGFILSGDILNDVMLQKACLFGVINYELNNYLEIQQVISFSLSDYDSLIAGSSDNPDAYEIYRFNKIYNVTKTGFYRLVGTFMLEDFAFGNNDLFSIYLDNVSIFFQGAPRDGQIHSIDVDIPFEITSISQEIRIEFSQMTRIFEDRNFGEINIVLISIRDDLGVLLPSVYFANKIDLTKSVPDITFGDFVKVVKNWFNYDLTVVGKLAIMNKVEDLMNFDNAINLSEFEVLYPLRKFHQGFSYLLKFQDIVSTIYTFLPVFQNKSSYVTSGYVTDDKTETIEIPALPLPSLTRNSSTTAYAIEDDDAKVYLVKYDGLINGKNISGTNEEYLIPAIHLTNWLKWFRLRINSQSFTISFKSWAEKIKDLTSKSKLHAYGQIHIVKTINKTEVKPGLFQVDIETETLK